MSTYYYLINYTKKEKINFNGLIKSNNIRESAGVHMAFINYMFDHQGDHIGILSDMVTHGFFGLEDWRKYKIVDLKTDYEFIDEELKKEIIKRYEEAIR